MIAESKPTSNHNIFQSFINSSDQEAMNLLRKLEGLIIHQDRTCAQSLGTKDPVLDVFMNLLRLYGVKIQFFYQNIENDQYLLRGVKDVGVLHETVRRLAKVMKLFPCAFIKSLGLSFILCEGLEVRDEALRMSEETLAEAIVIEKNATSEEVLQKHFVRVVFVHFMRSVVQNKGIMPEHFDFKHSLKAFNHLVQNYGRVDSKALRNEHAAKFIQILGNSF
jgi:hypothetical protein